MFSKFTINFLVLLIVAGVTGSMYVYYDKQFLNIKEPDISSVLEKEPSTVLLQKNTATTTVAQEIAKTPKAENATKKKEEPSSNKVIMPGALVAPKPSAVVSRTPLTTGGILYYTNLERQKNGGLTPLTRNYKLDQSAQTKLADMFEKQYFEHISPSGRGPGDLAKSVGYDFVLIGENLALGGFENDEAVVQAWMNSPGHRANILNSHYTEIGISAGEGLYEKESSWIAVQSFGTPLSSCPAVDSQLRDKIEKNNSEILSMESALQARLARVHATPKDDPNYNAYVGEYNELAKSYNELMSLNKGFAETYNSRVVIFNECVKVFSEH